MNLTDLVKSKFLPPLSYHYDRNAEFLVQKIGDKFVPCMKSDRCYKIYKTSDSITGSGLDHVKTLLSSKEEAIKMCWDFFKSNHYMISRVTNKKE